MARVDAVVLAGRCYERESVPYEAVDSLVDALCHYLLGLSTERADALMPRDAQTLATVFPVLRRVEAIAQAPRRARTAPDPREFRRRAFGALQLFSHRGSRGHRGEGRARPAPGAQAGARARPVVHGGRRVDSRRRRALVGADEGASLQEAAYAWCRGEKLANPEAVQRTFAPGF